MEAVSLSVFSWFREVAASMSAQASARKCVHLFPVTVDFGRDSPFGKRIRTPAPLFCTAWSANPYV